MQEGFETLRAQVVARGLFARTYGYYVLNAFALVFGICASLYLITLTQNVWVQFFNAAFLGMYFVQAGMLGHDLSHNQVFISRRLNSFFAIIVWGLLAGASASKWYERHNAHHKNPNKIDHDPDLEVPFLFSDKQLKDRSGFFKKYILPYQHVLFFFFLAPMHLSIHRKSFAYILRHPGWGTFFELILMLAHFTILILILIIFLPLPIAFLFFIAHSLIGGFYMGMVFAPNHKGEEVTEAYTKTTWINQITSTRNLYPSQFVFHFFGGLNFQVEHHLFPNMPRPHYWKAHTIVKEFCERNGIPFHETTWWGSMKEIYSALKLEAREQAVALSQ